MEIRTRVDVDGSGQAVVVRQAGPGAGAARLIREAQVLAMADHPGVPDLLGCTGSEAAGVTLTTAFAGVPVSPRGKPADQARVLGAVAECLADLHHRGIVHGRLRAEHILIAGAGQPRLVGWGTEEASPAPADDVATLAMVGLGLLDPDAGGDLRVLLERARAPDARARPSMRALATALSGMAKTAAPHRSAPAPITPRLRQRRTHRPFPRLVVPLLLAGLALGIAVPVSLVATRPPAATPKASVATVSPAPQRAPALVPVTNGVVTVEGQRYAVGDPDDDVVLGDWDCDGTATPAVVRPPDGRIWLFDSWPSASVTLVGRRLATGRGVEELSHFAVGGCDQGLGLAQFLDRRSPARGPRLPGRRRPRRR